MRDHTSRLVRITMYFLSILNSIIPKSSKILIFYDYGRFSDNPYYLFRRLVELGYNKKYQLIWVVSSKDAKRRVEAMGGQGIMDSDSLNILRYILRAKYYITSSGPPRWKAKNQDVIMLWHGIPLKRLLAQFEEYGKYIDYLVTSSETECLLLSSSFQVSPQKCISLGHPRCDALFLGRENSARLLERLLGYELESYDSVVMYLPTFRDYAPDATQDLVLSVILNQKFQNYLEKNNILFLVKPHPRDESFFREYESEHIRVITNQQLSTDSITVYDLLPAVDVLITDYSSVYFDYLLLNRPIVFYVPDLEEYRRTRGFLLEPYERWTPGDKARNISELIWTLDEALNNPDKWKKEREWLRDVMFKYQDGKSSERIIKYFWGDV